MKVLLINCPNRLNRQPEFFPYGLSLLSSVLKKNKIYTKIYDINLNRNIKEFISFLNKNIQWDIIGLSGIVTSYSFQKEISSIIRQLLPKSLIISGGGLASAIPTLLLEKTEIEITCIGEGEECLLDIIQNFKESIDFSNVTGIAWKNRKTHEIIKNKSRKFISDLDNLPFPDWEEANFSQYLNLYSPFYNKGIQARALQRRGDILISRGCQNHCSFCSNVYDRQSLRRRSPNNIIEEIKLLKTKYNIDSIDFLDESFLNSYNDTRKLCEMILENDLIIKWGSATRVDQVDDSILKLMNKSGCIFILYGFESGSNEILKRMNKKITIEKSMDSFVLTENNGIDARGNLIIGHPGENHTTMSDTIDFQKFRYNFLIQKYRYIDNLVAQLELKRRFETVSFVVPYPGSELFENVKWKIEDLESFMISISSNDASNFVINLSDLSAVELLGYQKYLSNPYYWSMINPLDKC